MKTKELFEETKAPRFQRKHYELIADLLGDVLKQAGITKMKATIAIQGMTTDFMKDNPQFKDTIFLKRALKAYRKGPEEEPAAEDE